MVIPSKSFDPCILLFVVRIFSSTSALFWVFSFLFFLDQAFMLLQDPFVSLNFPGSSYPSTWAVSNFLWLISGSKSGLIASNSTLTLVKIFLNVILIQPATLRTRNATSVVHCLCILLFCASHFFHLSAIIFSLCFCQPLFLLRTHCSCRWL